MRLLLAAGASALIGIASMSAPAAAHMRPYPPKTGQSDQRGRPAQPATQHLHATRTLTIRDFYRKFHQLVPGIAADASIPGTNCTLTAGDPLYYTDLGTPPGNQWIGFSYVLCQSGYDNLEIQTCLQQLVTGGWKTISSTCETGRNNNDDNVSSYTGGLSSLVKGRYYRTWAWGYVNGKTSTTESSGVKG